MPGFEVGAGQDANEPMWGWMIRGTVLSSAAVVDTSVVARMYVDLCPLPSTETLCRAA